MGVCRPSDRSDDCESVDCCEDSSKPSGPTGPAAEEPAFPLEGGGGGGPEADELLVGGVGPLCVEVGGIALATEASSKNEIDGQNILIAATFLTQMINSMFSISGLI